MRFLCRTLKGGHDFLPPPTPGEMQEQQKTLHIAFIDLTKAFDLVSLDGLFNILLKIGCPLNLHSMVRSFHDDMKATIQYKRSMSEPFNIKSGVKQGCILWCLLLNTYLIILIENAQYKYYYYSPSSFLNMPLGPRPKECTCIQGQMASCTTSQDAEQTPRSPKPP